jgi:hypothetical protein
MSMRTRLQIEASTERISVVPGGPEVSGQPPSVGPMTISPIDSIRSVDEDEDDSDNGDD